MSRNAYDYPGNCEPNKLEFMFMKHYAPNRCEPSIKALNFRGGGGGIRVDVTE